MSHPAAAAFRRIVDWLGATVPAVDGFHPPATSEAVDALNRALATPAVKGLTAAMVVSGEDPPGEPDPDGPSFGRPLPEELAAVLSVHDGGDPCGFLPVTWSMYDPSLFYLLSCTEIAHQYRCQRDLLAVGEFAGNVPDETGRGVRETWWDVGWLPFAGNGGGDFVCLDYAPAAGGTPGQVITHDHEIGEHRVLAPSLTVYLEEAAASLETGRFAWDEDEEDLMPVTDAD